MKFSNEFYVALKKECKNRGVKFEQLTLCDGVTFNGLTVPSIWIIDSTCDRDTFEELRISVHKALDLLLLEDTWVDTDNDGDAYEVDEVLTWEQLESI